LEHVHVRGIVCRCLRLELVAGIGIALAMPALAMTVENGRRLATQTSMAAETRDQRGRTQATVFVNVTGADGLPATGAVTMSDRGTQLAGAALNAKGEASIVLTLPAGDHALSATYTGDATHKPSASAVAQVSAQVTGTPNFTVSVSPASLSLTAGQSGTIVASVTPQNSAALTAPMFITMSCAGLPDQSSCTFTPENIEVLPGATVALTSSMVILTQSASSASIAHPQSNFRGSNSVAWAILFPGALTLGGLAWGARRRAWLSRFSVLGLLALIAVLGTTACNPRYDYFNHGPPINPATPAGTYTINVTAQSSNGVSAITNSTSMVLTVR
jgi:hypothetical protein